MSVQFSSIGKPSGHLPRMMSFDEDPVTVARRLLGQRLVRCLDGKRLSGRIVEVEAYLGVRDRAAHTFGGRRTPRNESMYLPGGHVYVYFTYGMHHCLNVVCGRKDVGVAVLIRAIEPQEGLETMQRHRPRVKSALDLCSGPAKLTAALQIDRRFDGVDLRTSKEIWIERLEPRQVSPRMIVRSARIGVEYAGAWAKRRLRFSLAGNRFVSK